jgi:hypothetical protein
LNGDNLALTIYFLICAWFGGWGIANQDFESNAPSESINTKAMKTLSTRIK